MRIFIYILRFFPPEIAHTLALKSLNILYSLKLSNIFFRKPKSNSKKINFCGLKFKNRLGIAAGLDKNGDYIDALGSLGIGFIEVGTVTPEPQPGNLKPRIFRLFKYNAIINRLGFNNKGIDHLKKNLQKRKYDGIVGVNIGVNKNSSGQERIRDYLHCIKEVYKYADYITINISSPNTPNLRDLQSIDNITELIVEIEKVVKNLRIKIPIFMKISPDEKNNDLIKIANLINDSKISGIIATNTTVSRSMALNHKLFYEEGGLSGMPLFERSNSVISLCKSVAPQLPIIGVGGVYSKKDFDNKINMGCELVQIYTSFIIRGPAIIKEILK